MNILVKTLVTSIFVLGTSIALADGNARVGTDGGGQASGSDVSSGTEHYRNRHHRERRHRREHRRHRRHGDDGAYSAPELNASQAPLAILLIGGLLVAGLERRRKNLL